MSQAVGKPGPRFLWLPWAIGGVAAGIAVVAFALWGLNGPTFLLDLIAAYCF
jgi:hypothetical protein